MDLGLTVTLPSWVENFLTGHPGPFATLEERMALVIALSKENIQHHSGGPFGAAVFDQDGCLIAPGVNVVVTHNCSILHAEMVAIALAQKSLGHYDLSAAQHGKYQLVASTEPCAMCYGAVPWSGVTELVCGARDEDARRIGFDEGPKLDNWQQALEQRGIRVVRDVLRAEAVAILDHYAHSGFPIYNALRERGETKS